MNTMPSIVNQILGTLESTSTPSLKENEPLKLSQPEPENSCKTAWQRKWLKLDCRAPEIHELSEKAESFCGRWFRNNPQRSLLVLVGNPGCGKTHTAMAIFRFCLAAAQKAFEARGWDSGGRVPVSTFARWPEIVDGFKSGDYSILPQLMDEDLVVLDDIGADKDPSKNGADKLCQILSRRERKFTIITTNIQISSWSVELDSRIDDRLLRNSDVVNLTSLESYQGCVI